MLKLSTVFQDKAVFQRGKAIPVWGKCDAAAKLKIEFADQAVFGRSNAEGYFKIRLKAVDAGGPYTLKVTVCDSGESVDINDILVGDVWLASGQSNMEYALGSDWTIPASTNPPGLNRMQEQEFKNNIKNPEKLRFIVVEKTASCIEEDSFVGEWKYLNAENAAECSAVAAWFAKYIQEKIDIPVGIIVSAYGGTIAESWTSRAGLLSNPDTAYLAEYFDKINHDEEIWGMSEAEILKTVIPEKYIDSGNEGVKWGWAETDFDDSSWQNMNVPGSWIVQEISGNGSVWARREIELSDDWYGKDLVIDLGGVDKLDITYFNGVEIGRTGSGIESQWYDKPRHYEIPASLVKKGKNVIAVRAYSFLYDGSFNGEAESYKLSIKDTETKINISGKWKACPEKDMGILAGNALRLGPCNANTPSILFNCMLRPLMPYALKGAIWYQGESNTKNKMDSYRYFKKLEVMIRDWYYNFEQGEFPFIQVQLANFSRGLEDMCNSASTWAILRDKQRLLCKKMDNVYMASAIDIGDKNDIHPQDKKTVGYRLAQNALHNVYFFNDIVPEGPSYKGHIIENNKIRLIFDNADGMYIKEDLPQSFYVAGENEFFYPADEVVIERNTILVSSREVDNPYAVRYAWAFNPSNTLYNAAGLPASSFQTDK